MNFKTLTDEKLILLVRKNDVNAFEEIYARYSTRILHYFYRMLSGNYDKAQDLLQDLFLKLLQKSHLFNETQRFSTWIYTIAHNMCRNEYRNQSVRLKAIQNGNIDAEISHESESASLNIDIKLLKQAIDTEVNKLDENHRTTFILRFQENMSIKEISQVLNCSEGTTKSRLFYTTRDLTIKLKEYNPI